MIYLNTIEQLFFFVENLDQLEVCLPDSRLLTGNTNNGGIPKFNNIYCRLLCHQVWFDGPMDYRWTLLWRNCTGPMPNFM